MQEIPLHLLQALLVFGDSPNSIAASKKLGLSQPGLSKQLTQLEERLPLPLFVMKGRKKALTPFGQDLHQKLKEKLGNMNEVVRGACVRHASPKDSTIRIFARRGLLDRISSKVQFPGALHFIDSSHEEVIEAVKGLRAELGITHSVPDTHELIAKPLWREAFKLIVPKSQMPRRPRLDRELFLRLKDLPCVSYKPRDEILRSIFIIYEIDAASIFVARATENYLSLTEMVQKGLGWAIVPAYIKTSSMGAWGVALPASALPPRDFFIVYRSELASTPWFRKLVAEIHTCFEAY